MFKKSFTMLLVLVMVMAIGVPVFAAENAPETSFDSSNVYTVEPPIKGWDSTHPNYWTGLVGQKLKV